MQRTRRYEEACDFLKENKLRYSRQRMVVVNELFFSNGNKRHFKLNELLDSIQNNHDNINISSASLINILKGLCSGGYIKEVYINRPYYDIITNPHLHFYDADKGELMDIYNKDCMEYISSNITPPQGYEIAGINCVVKINKN
jgi:Fe2+ or Zn2+ uptake regulation protein